MTGGLPPGYRADPHLRMIRACLLGGLLYTAVVVTVVVVDPRPGRMPKLRTFDQELFGVEGAIVFAVFAALLCWVVIVIGGLRSRPPDDPPERVVLGAAALLSVMIGLYFVVLMLAGAVFLDLGAPPALDEKFNWLHSFVMVSWVVAMLVLIGTAIAVRTARDWRRAGRRRRVGRIVLTVVLCCR